MFEQLSLYYAFDFVWSNEYNLYCAVRSKNLIRVKKYLAEKKRLDVNWINKGDGTRTALYMAAMCGYDVIVKELLKVNADPNIVDGDGWSPLYAACYLGYPKVVKALMHYKADPNIRDPGRRTPLYIASLCGNMDCVHELTALKRTELDKSEEDGRTALYVACEFGHADVVRELCMRGADYEKENKNGWTPLAASIFLGKASCVEVLLRYDPDITPSMMSLCDDTPNPDLSIKKMLVDHCGGATAMRKDAYLRSMSL